MHGDNAFEAMDTAKRAPVVYLGTFKSAIKGSAEF